MAVNEHLPVTRSYSYYIDDVQIISFRNLTESASVVKISNVKLILRMYSSFNTVLFLMMNRLL